MTPPADSIRSRVNRGLPEIRCVGSFRRHRPVPQPEATPGVVWEVLILGGDSNCLTCHIRSRRESAGAARTISSHPPPCSRGDYRDTVNQQIRHRERPSPAGPRRRSGRPPTHVHIRHKPTSAQGIPSSRLPSYSGRPPGVTRAARSASGLSRQDELPAPTAARLPAGVLQPRVHSSRCSSQDRSVGRGEGSGGRSVNYGYQAVPPIQPVEPGRTSAGGQPLKRRAPRSPACLLLVARQAAPPSLLVAQRAVRLHRG